MKEWWTFGAWVDMEPFIHGVKQLLNCCLLWEVKVTYGIPGKLACWLPWLLLVILTKMRGKRCSLGMPLVFVLFFQVARERVTEFPKMSFGWAKTINSLHCSLLQVGEKKSYISSQGWSTISDKTEGSKGRKTLQRFLQLSCHLCCNGQGPFPPPLPLHSSGDLSPTTLMLTL